jgi:hypothetical protein
LKYAVLTFLVVLTGASGTLAQERIFRCSNNEYTNDQTVAKAKNCKPIQGGNVSVIAGTAVKSPAPSTPVASGSAAQKVDVNDQRARDSDARGVLEAELKRAEARRAELLAEYKDGKPDHQGIESRNHQKYLDRVAELKAAIARTESDIAGIRRELGRSPAPAPASAGAAPVATAAPASGAK